MQVAREILNQLGGNMFVMMTGVKNLVAGENTLSMKLAKNKSKATHLRITLNGLDLYDVEFLNIRGVNVKTVETHENIYNDMLRSTFTEVTGMYTSLRG